jgi:hypothetical protein
MSGICNGSRIQLSAVLVRSWPCWAVMALCRFAGQMSTNRTAAVIPAHRSRRHSPTAQMSSATPLA